MCLCDAGLVPSALFLPVPSPSSSKLLLFSTRRREWRGQGCWVKGGNVLDIAPKSMAHKHFSFETEWKHPLSPPGPLASPTYDYKEASYNGGSRGDGRKKKNQGRNPKKAKPNEMSGISSPPNALPLESLAIYRLFPACLVTSCVTCSTPRTLASFLIWKKAVAGKERRKETAKDQERRCPR